MKFVGPAPSDPSDLVNKTYSDSTAQTLTNKTLVSPRVSTGIVDTNGNTVLGVTPAASAVNYLTVANGATGILPAITAAGSDSNIGLGLYAKGSGLVTLRNTTNGISLAAGTVASGVNYVLTNNAVTGSAPFIQASGNDTNINLNLLGKGTGTVQANGVDVVTTTGSQTLTNKTLTSPKIAQINDSNGNAVLATSAIANAVNYVTVHGAAGTAYPGLILSGTATDIGMWIAPKGAGSVGVYAPTGQTAKIVAGGVDANIDLELTSKGTGVVRANGAAVVTGTASQTLTNKTISGASNTLSNIPQSAVTSLTTDLGNKASVYSTGVGGSISYGSMLKRVSLDTNPESLELTQMPGFYNDLAFNVLRGGTVTVTKNGVDASGTQNGGDNWFKPDTSMTTWSGSASLVSTDTFVITVGVHETTSLLRYGQYVGIAFPGSWGAKDVTIEVYWGGAWYSAHSTTNNNTSTHVAYYSANGGTPITQIRYTLTNLWIPGGTAQFRISSLFAFSYASGLLSAGYLTREGGALYGSSAAPVTLTATGGDANISLNLVSKGTGTVRANNVAVRLGDREGYTTELDASVLTLPRHLSHSEVESWAGVESGAVMLTYVRPQRSRTINNLAVGVDTPAGGTPTVARMAVYSVASNGDLTLLASTTHDAAIVTTGYTVNSKALNTSAALTAGSVYAFALLVVSAGAMPKLRGRPGDFGEFALAPRLTGRRTGQTDLPSSITNTDVWSSGAALYMRGS